MIMNKIVALVGMCGSGKSVVNDYFVKKDYFSVYFGGITMEELEKRGLPVGPESEKTIREELRETHGMAAYAILSLPKIEGALKQSNVIVDGLYSWSEYKILKEKFGENLIVIAVYSPPKMRYERLASRKVRPISNEDARKRDYAEIENIEKAGPIAMADFTLVNTGSMEELIDQLNNIQ
jgi:dephospho-CoA kinase